MPRPCTTCRGQARAADNHDRAEGRVMEDVNMEDIDIDGPTDPVSLLCEIKHLEQRHVDGQAILLDLDGGPNQNHLSRDWWFSHYALCTIRSYSDTGRLINHALYVNSQSLRDFLQAVIGDLEADGSGGMAITVKAPFFPLFYNLERLTSHSKRFAPFVYSRPETELLLSWIRSHFRREIELVESNTANPETTTIPFESLWAAFPPRSIVCPLVVHLSQAARVVECWYVRGACPSLVLKAEYVDWDGESMGLRDFEIAIESYAGTKRLVDLSARPLKSMKNPSTVRKYLLDCGRKFESYTGMRLKHYDGVAIAHDKRVHISGHIMLDDKSYCRSRNITPAPMRKTTRVPKQVSARPELTTNTASQLAEDDAMITALTIRGIYLNDDLPAQFVVASISDVQWNEQCLDELVMDSETKQTLQAHMARQDKANDGDSAAAAEGPQEKQDKGFVCILSGPSGVGKTTTAVTLSASAQRPVYRISGRRLDTFSLDGDVYLSEAMARAAEWGATLLIEETDRLLGNKALREVLLRALDRHNASIVFLTTTRTLESEDWRLRLRALPHQEEVRLSYPDEAARLQLWQKALRARSRHVGGGGGGGAPELDWLRGLARDYPFNGWQIEFAVGRACDAAADGYPGFAHLDEGARAAANPGAAGGGWGQRGVDRSVKGTGPEEASARLFRSRP
ncbi:P-loop containing nucleoside triphosphate hydrolase protein [Biscogniauxia mediterranea]|nr:P-loop containing nucleoside triphosphate hydrolase protein [Biscogniauxia mediterranea]